MQAIAYSCVLNYAYHLGDPRSANLV